MGQYCNSAELERHWFNWLLSSAVPALEGYRRLGLLWTKVVGVALDGDGKEIVKGGTTLPDPKHPKRLHCIATSSPVFFESNDGVVSQSLPDLSELTLLSESPIHCLDNDRFRQYDVVVPQLRMSGYVLESTEVDSWAAMLADVNSICNGIATKFNPANEEEKNDLANEAIVQVANKLRTRKLTYTPGRAPVFNLLTTTTYRCLYSVMNRRKLQRQGMAKLFTDCRSNSVPETQRSYRYDR